MFLLFRLFLFKTVANLQRQKVYVRNCWSPFFYFLSQPAGRNIYNENSRNCGYNVICFRLQGSCTSHCSIRYQGVGLCLQEPWDYHTVITMGPLDKLAIGLSPRHWCIDMKDRKMIYHFLVYLFSGGLEMGNLVSNNTYCKSPEVLSMGCFPLFQALRCFNTYSPYARTLDFVMFVQQVVSDLIIMI